MITPDFHECRVVNVETVSGCNLECSYCSLRNRPLGFMAPELLERILRGFKDGGCRDDLLVALYLGGEPFLNKDFARLIALTKRMGFRNIRTHTNGTVFRYGMWREVFDAGLTSVVFSVDGTDPEDFERLRPGAKFADVLHNIEVCGQTLRAFEDRSWGVEVGVLCLIEEPKPLVLNSGLEPVRRYIHKVMVERPHGWLKPGQSRCGENPQNPCFFSLNHMAIDVDGNYLPCCLCLNSEAKLGSALDIPARAAWEGPMEELRERQRRGEEFHPCSTCERYVR